MLIIPQLRGVVQPNAYNEGKSGPEVMNCFYKMVTNHFNIK